MYVNRNAKKLMYAVAIRSMNTYINMAFSFRCTVMYLHIVQHMELPRQSYFDAKKLAYVYITKILTV